MLNERSKLPVFKSKEQILGAIDRNRVTIIRGETGSGKTTQVGSYRYSHCLRPDTNMYEVQTSYE